jgi:hypothetical protein
MKYGNKPINPISQEMATTKDEYGNKNQWMPITYGMTLREHFASLAMQGIMSNEGGFDPLVVAKNSVLMADALIEELNKGSI